MSVTDVIYIKKKAPTDQDVHKFRMNSMSERQRKGQTNNKKNRTKLLDVSERRCDLQLAI